MAKGKNPGTVASMTGFGRAEGGDDRYRWAWELRSVNGRGLDLRLRVGMGFERLDGEIRKRLGNAFSRGSFTASFDIRASSEQPDVVVNETLLDALTALCRARGQEPQIDKLLTVRGVLDSADDRQSAADDQERCAEVLRTLDEAIGQLQAARNAEGLQTGKTLSARIDEIAELVDRANGLDATRLTAIQARLEAQIQELLGTPGSIDPEKLAQEVAILATKADIREELDRLNSHIGAARKLLSDGGTFGRKLDFLTQEFNREANTLCSKSSDTELTNIGLDLKAVIDQVKEQAANIE